MPPATPIITAILSYPDADRENLLPLEPSLHPWLLLQLFTDEPVLETRSLISAREDCYGRYYLTVQNQRWAKKLAIPRFRASSGSKPSTRIGRRQFQPLDLVVAFAAVIHMQLSLLISIATGLWIDAVTGITVAPFIASWGTYFTGMATALRFARKRS